MISNYQPYTDKKNTHIFTSFYNYYDKQLLTAKANSYQTPGHLLLRQHVLRHIGSKSSQRATTEDNKSPQCTTRKDNINLSDRGLFPTLVNLF